MTQESKEAISIPTRQSDNPISKCILFKALYFFSATVTGSLSKPTPPQRKQNRCPAGV